MRSPRTAAGLLLGAAAMIENRGLAIGELQDADGCVCTIRAMQAQVLGDSFFVPWWETETGVMPDHYRQALVEMGRYLGWPDYWGADLLEEQVIAWSDTGLYQAGLVTEVLRGAAAESARRPVAASVGA